MLRFSNGKWNANENGETMMNVYKWKLVIIHKCMNYNYCVGEKSKKCLILFLNRLCILNYNNLVAN